jgi:hypothetical protein
MKNFVEVTPIGQGIGGNLKVSISVDNILSLKPDLNWTIITLNEIVNGTNVQLKVSESYDEVKRKIDLRI